MQSSDPGKKVGYRDQDHELTKDRYDHAVYCFSESLEYCSTDDTEPGDQIMNPDDTQCRNTDGEHIFGSIEHSKKNLWNQLKR